MSDVEPTAPTRSRAFEGARPIESVGGVESARRAVAGLSDSAMATVVGVVLFAGAAFPLLLTEVPPYQDVPNHLATATVLAHLDEYPELVSNGFLKTNAALFAWLHLAGRWLDLGAAVKLFAAGVLAANAFVLPRFVLALTDRRRMLIASLFAWPMIHNWFVSMGMLDFALSVPVALLLLLALDAPPRKRGAAAIVGLGLATWYAHVFSLLVVHLIVALRVAEECVAAFRRGGRAAALEALRARARGLLPLVPVTAITAFSILQHATEPTGEWTGHVDARRSLPVWELVYNAWSEWFYGFTPLSATSLVAALALLVVAARARGEGRGLLSLRAIGVLAALYAVVPYCMTNWFHVNSRLLPFIWIGLLLRVPMRLPKRVIALLATAAATYFVGQGIDFVRLDRERAVFTEGIGAVPEHARLLPLVFRHKETSDNTRNLSHLWGYYVVEKHTSAPLLFAHSRSFPVRYLRPPPPRFNQLVLEHFASNMATPAWTCEVLRGGGVASDGCEASWRERWREFWNEATPRFDHVLAWDISPEAEALVPPSYKAIFRNEKLVIFQRLDDRVALTD